MSFFFNGLQDLMIQNIVFYRNRYYVKSELLKNN